MLLGLGSQGGGAMQGAGGGLSAGHSPGPAAARPCLGLGLMPTGCLGSSSAPCGFLISRKQMLITQHN